jgi:hypothetical protein
MITKLVRRQVAFLVLITMMFLVGYLSHRVLQHFPYPHPRLMGTHQECTLGTLVPPKVEVSDGDVVTPSSSSFKSNTMNAEFIRNQFWSRISITWTLLNSMLLLVAPCFVDANKSHNLLYKFLNTITTQFTWIPYSTKTTKLINFLAT